MEILYIDKKKISFVCLVDHDYINAPNYCVKYIIDWVEKERSFYNEKDRQKRICANLKYKEINKK